MKQQPMKEKDELLNLYVPEKEVATASEKLVLDVSQEAVSFLKENRPEKYSKSDDWGVLQKVMLIWACNSFQGGRIYSQISRVNHDCIGNADH